MNLFESTNVRFNSRPGLFMVVGRAQQTRIDSISRKFAASWISKFIVTGGQYFGGWASGRERGGKPISESRDAGICRCGTDDWQCAMSSPPLIEPTRGAFSSFAVFRIQMSATHVNLTKAFVLHTKPRVAFCLVGLFGGAVCPRGYGAESAHHGCRLECHRGTCTKISWLLSKSSDHRWCNNVAPLSQ